MVQNDQKGSTMINNNECNAPSKETPCNNPINSNVTLPPDDNKESLSIENVLKSSMFKKFYEINKNMANLNQNSNYDSSPGEESQMIDSDDSYAADFTEHVKKIIVYSSEEKFNFNENYNQITYGGLFRVILLKNKRTNSLYAFLIKLQDKLNLRQDELWLWWK
ncbi:unnamed protein product [Brachionus calyciflorus]|uniref:Uncharacterized protein n=1 Tax=Brachionus calyciflorus TaxID=104777 RepID=A0A813M4A9_9BILA|nr:unnamed protein product [Brachionus calyciflorus]